MRERLPAGESTFCVGEGGLLQVGEEVPIDVVSLGSDALLQSGERAAIPGEAVRDHIRKIPVSTLRVAPDLCGAQGIWRRGGAAAPT